MPSDLQRPPARGEEKGRPVYDLDEIVDELADHALAGEPHPFARPEFLNTNSPT